MNVAVVGHVEWVEFIRVEEVPRPGQIVHSLERWEEAAGGGAVAAVQLAKLNGSVHFFTALGDDELGRRAKAELEGRGVTVHSTAAGDQRRAFTYIDANGERTITVLGEKALPSPGLGDLPWEELARCDAVYFVSGEVDALQAARRARVLAATSRELATLKRAGEEIDVLVGSGNDPGERFEHGDLDPPPRAVVTTAGSLGGWLQPGGPFRAAPLPGPIEDAYGCGDCFAAGLTYGLATGASLEDAVAIGARCGAAVLTGRGAYAAQLDAVELSRLEGEQLGR